MVPDTFSGVWVGHLLCGSHAPPVMFIPGCCGNTGVLHHYLMQIHPLFSWELCIATLNVHHWLVPHWVKLIQDFTFPPCWNTLIFQATDCQHGWCQRIPPLEEINNGRCVPASPLHSQLESLLSGPCMV